MGKKTKIILTSTTKSLGQKGGFKEVTNGFFRNFLLKNKMAVVYSDKINEGFLKKHSSEKHINYDVLQGQCLYFERKSSGVGMLYGSVSKLDIINEIKKIYNIEIKKNQITQNNPMKKTGLYDIEVCEEKMYIAIANTIDESRLLMLEKTKEKSSNNREIYTNSSEENHNTFSKSSDHVNDNQNDNTLKKDGEKSEF